MMKCAGCNICNQYRSARVTLAPLYVDYLRTSGVVEIYNRDFAVPLKTTKARIDSQGLVVARACELVRLIGCVPVADFDRLEVKGIVLAMSRFLDESVFSHPMTSTDFESITNLKAGIDVWNRSLERPQIFGLLESIEI